LQGEHLQGGISVLISAQHLLGFLASAAQSPFSNYWSKLTDANRNPFRGLYQLNAFDLAVMIPYFLVLVILAAYGLHRYYLVYAYFKNRDKVPGPPPAIAEWPKVTIQLPIYNERYVIERLVDAIARFDYPRELLDIQVLDDSTDETQEVARTCVERYQALGLPIHYLHRNDRTGFKAGALSEGLKSATGEFVAIFDADFVPAADFLRRALPYLADPRIAMVQARWTYLNRHYSPLTEVETILLDGHFVLLGAADKFIRIESQVFAGLHLNGIVLLEAAPELIAARQAQRNDRPRSLEQISAFMEAERIQAEVVAAHLKIRCLVLNSPSLAEFTAAVKFASC